MEWSVSKYGRACVASGDRADWYRIRVSKWAGEEGDHELSPMVNQCAIGETVVTEYDDTDDIGRRDRLLN